MSFFRPVALEHASRLLNHGPTILVTTTDGTRANIMAAAWSTPVEFTPPRIAVVIDKSTFSREWLQATGKFGICVPGAALIDLTFALGNVSGRDTDKFEKYGLQRVDAPVLGVPVIETGCAAWLELRYLPLAQSENDYDTFFGEVVSAAADERIFSDGHWKFDDTHPDLHTIHHIGAGKFVRASSIITAKPV